jgi:hypothetical protein
LWELKGGVGSGRKGGNNNGASSKAGGAEAVLSEAAELQKAVAQKLGTEVTVAVRAGLGKDCSASQHQSITPPGFARAGSDPARLLRQLMKTRRKSQLVLACR